MNRHSEQVNTLDFQTGQETSLISDRVSWLRKGSDKYGQKTPFDFMKKRKNNIVKPRNTTPLNQCIDSCQDE